MENCNHELVFVQECTKCGKTFDTILPDSKPQTQEEWLSLEKQYSAKLGRLAELCSIVVPWMIDNHGSGACVTDEIASAADEIMEYVEAVRP